MGEYLAQCLSTKKALKTFKPLTYYNAHKKAILLCLIYRNRLTFIIGS